MFDVLGIMAPFAFSPVSSSSPGCRQVLVGLKDPVYSSRAFQQQIPHFRDWHPGFLHGADEAADTGFSVTGRESSDEGFVLIWPTSSGYDFTAVVLCLIWSTSLGGWICQALLPFLMRAQRFLGREFCCMPEHHLAAHLGRGEFWRKPDWA
jgi:hypothetical protein